MISAGGRPSGFAVAYGLDVAAIWIEPERTACRIARHSDMLGADLVGPGARATLSRDVRLTDHHES